MSSERIMLMGKNHLPWKNAPYPNSIDAALSVKKKLKCQITPIWLWLICYPIITLYTHTSHLKISFDFSWEPYMVMLFESISYSIRDSSNESLTWHKCLIEKKSRYPLTIALIAKYLYPYLKNWLRILFQNCRNYMNCVNLKIQELKSCKGYCSFVFSP